jgi:hypothetical protein
MEAGSVMLSFVGEFKGLAPPVPLVPPAEDDDNPPDPTAETVAVVLLVEGAEAAAPPRPNAAEAEADMATEDELPSTLSGLRLRAALPAALRNEGSPFALDGSLIEDAKDWVDGDTKDSEPSGEVEEAESADVGEVTESEVALWGEVLEMDKGDLMDGA